MTHKEALTAVLDGVSFSANTLEKVLTDHSLTGGDTYSTAVSKTIDLCAIDLLMVAFTHPDITEGGYGLSHPDFMRKIQSRLHYLASKHGLTDILAGLEKKPTIKDASKRW